MRGKKLLSGDTILIDTHKSGILCRIFYTNMQKRELCATILGTMPIFFIVLAVIMFALLGILHISVYAGFVSIFSVTDPHTLLALKLIIGLLFAGFVFGIFIVSKYNTPLTKFIYGVSATWMGFFFYFLIATAIFYLIAFIAGQNQFNPAILWMGRTLMAAALCVGIYGIYHAQNITIQPITVVLAGAPESWNGRKAVLYADTHLGQILDKKFAVRVAEKIKSLKPDIVFDGGDIYDGVAVDETEIIEPFADIHAPLGHFFVMGNHEEFRDNKTFADAIRGAGMRILDNEILSVDGVQIIGVDYAQTADKEAFKDILDGIPIDSHQPSILLKHVPFDLDVTESKGISLQLSGHTHQAQIFPLGLITKIVYKGYDYGFKKFKSMQVLTTSGVGTWGPPLRVGTQAELVLITFSVPSSIPSIPPQESQ